MPSFNQPSFNQPSFNQPTSDLTTHQTANSLNAAQRPAQPKKAVSAQSLINVFYDEEIPNIPASWLCISQGAERYGIITSAIYSVFPLADIIPAPGSHRAVMGLINLRSRIIPLIDFATLLEPAPLSAKHNSANWHPNTLAACEGRLALALEIGDEIYALLPQAIHNIIEEEALDNKGEGHASLAATERIEPQQNDLIAKIFHHDNALLAILNLEAMIAKLSAYNHFTKSVK